MSKKLRNDKVKLMRKTLLTSDVQEKTARKLSRILAVSTASAALFFVPVVGAVVLLPALTTSALAVKGHKHSHLSGHALLGEKIHHDGKYSLGTHGGRAVTVEV